ncbi:MAG: glutathione S-transferase [Brachymonas sp.]|nr:glutathione S-transferase [Brachymonas sp.]
MPHPLLYTYRRCPYAMRARMALIEAGIAFDAYEIVLRDKPAAMLAASPKGTVPVMVLPSGEVLDESMDIMRWAFEQHGDAHWWDEAQTPSNQALVALNDGAFKKQLDTYKYPDRFAPGASARQRDLALGDFLSQLEQRLRAEKYLGGNQACAADLAIFPLVRQFRAVNEKWFDAQALPATQAWLQAWLASTLFERCMKKLPSNERVVF